MCHALGAECRAQREQAEQTEQTEQTEQAEQEKFFVFSLDKTRKAFFVFQKRLPQKVTLFVFLIFGGKFRKIKNRGSNYTKPSLERKTGK